MPLVNYSKQKVNSDYNEILRIRTQSTQDTRQNLNQGSFEYVRHTNINGEVDNDAPDKK